jgi:hypothetical protein
MRAHVILTAAVAALVLGTTVPAAAGAAGDPDDTGGRLDIRRLVTREKGGDLVGRIRTWDPWRNRVLRGRGPNRLFVWIDWEGDGSREAFVRLIQRRGDRRIRVELCGLDGACAADLNYAARPDRRTVRFRIGVTSPDMEVRAASRFQRAGSPCHPCRDRAPDRGWIPAA